LISKLNYTALSIGVFLSLFFAVAIFYDQEFLFAIPLALGAMYFALFQTEKAFLALAFLTPLSFNIEEYVDGFGLYIPTEPLLFGLMLYLCALQIKAPFLNNKIFRHPIILAWFAILIWMFLTAITSSNPLVSFKFILSKLWFIIPLLLFGTYFFSESKNRILFIWLFVIGTVVSILYTIGQHASFNFGEKESHWVMWPFFKDHTIYGAIVALVLPLVLILIFIKKNTPLIQMVLICLLVIVLLGLYFSYTRAAWLSIFCAFIFGFLVHIKLNKKIIYGALILGTLITYFKWDSIQMELARNKEEHTTEQFGERLQSAANVTTDASNLERINRWSCAIDMFKERPIFGYGPGTFSFEYARFQQAKNLTIISTKNGDMGNAHSEYLSALSEMGFIGLILFSLFVFVLFSTSIRLYHYYTWKDRAQKVLVMGIITALASYFIHAFLNNFLDTDKAAVPVFALCSFIVVLDVQRRRAIELS
jgi:O-antigen ligase